MAPGPLNLTLVAYAAIMVPGAVVAAFGGPWWFIFMAAAPGLVMLTRLGWAGARVRGLRSHDDAPRSPTRYLASVTGPGAVLAADAIGLNWTALIGVATIILIDLADRAWWQRYERRVRAPVIRERAWWPSKNPDDFR